IGLWGRAGAGRGAGSIDRARVAPVLVRTRPNQTEPCANGGEHADHPQKKGAPAAVGWRVLIRPPAHLLSLRIAGHNRPARQEFPISFETRP
ncbi:MAG: hypothetical protein VXZ43_05580, partial [Pseudomonadota bacterium]|nr:hypothetical protein [Pseudomonadota bacterium]